MGNKILHLEYFKIQEETEGQEFDEEDGRRTNECGISVGQ